MPEDSARLGGAASGTLATEPPTRKLRAGGGGAAAALRIPSRGAPGHRAGRANAADAVVPDALSPAHASAMPQGRVMAPVPRVARSRSPCRRMCSECPSCRPNWAHEEETPAAFVTVVARRRCGDTSLRVRRPSQMRVRSWIRRTPMGPVAYRMALVTSSLRINSRASAPPLPRPTPAAAGWRRRGHRPTAPRGRWARPRSRCAPRRSCRVRATKECHVVARCHGQHGVMAALAPSGPVCAGRRQDTAQALHALVDVVPAVLDQAVGVEHDAAALGQQHPVFSQRQPAQTQRRAGRYSGQVGLAVRMYEDGSR